MLGKRSVLVGFSKLEMCVLALNKMSKLGNLSFTRHSPFKDRSEGAITRDKVLGRQPVSIALLNLQRGFAHMRQPTPLNIKTGGRHGLLFGQHNATNSKATVGAALGCAPFLATGLYQP
jgi:hypothetical protein